MLYNMHNTHRDADDLELLAVDGPEALQQLLGVVHLHCRLFDMEFICNHIKQPCNVIFQQPRTHLPRGLNWCYNDQKVHVYDRYVDLRALHHGTVPRALSLHVAYCHPQAIRLCMQCCIAM
jgi:hypothetical protein